MHRYILYALVFMFCCRSSQASGRNIECTRLNGSYIPVFTENDPAEDVELNGINARSLRELGFPPGFDGELYDEPDTAIVDAMSEISTKVDLVNARINQILEQCSAPTWKEGGGGHGSSDDCEVEEFGLCFWLVAYGARNVTMLNAWEICGTRPGGRPASIYSPAHYIKIVRLMRSKIIRPKFYSYIWLGMKINQRTKVVNTLEGSRAPFVRWYASMYPILNSRYTQIYLYADLTRADGFMNFNPLKATNGVLCETMV